MSILGFMKHLALPGKLLVGRRGKASALTTAVNWAALRAPPTDHDRVLVSETHLWLRSVPRVFHPRRLCLDHPQAANRIARSWHDPELVDRLLNDFLTDERGGRVGFPPRIVDELKLLRRFYEQPQDAWLYVAATVKRPRRRRASTQEATGP